MQALTPREIVAELDKHIIGQNDAKKAVAIALRNRWRWQQLPEEVQTVFVFGHNPTVYYLVYNLLNQKLSLMKK